MTTVRLLVGTKKGAFILTSDGSRKSWKIDGPHMGGWEVYHLQGTQADPNRIFASQSSGWFGQVIQRSDDGGATWSPVGNDFRYAGEPGTHLWFDGTERPWAFTRVWQFSAVGSNPDHVLAGVEDAGLFRSEDGGMTWVDMPGLRIGGSGHAWQPGAGGMCLHTILVHPTNEQSMHVAISAAGVFGTEDGGETWQPRTKGLRSEFLPDQEAELGHCVHAIARHPDRPDTLFMQKHWDVMRSDDGGGHWREVSGNLPSDFGFVIGVHAQEPETVYVIPITSDSEHYPPEGKLRVYRTRSGGDDWEPLGKGLPEASSYVNVLRSALAIDTMDPCGVYFGTTGGQLYSSSDSGDSWNPIDATFPAILSVEVQVLS